MKENLCVGKLFTLPLHQDVKHCPRQSFRSVKVVCKQDLPLTWLKYISCIILEFIFLVAAYEHAWRGSGLAVFSLCWSLMLYFTAVSQHLRKTADIPAPTGDMLSSARGSNDYGDKGVKVTCRNSKCSEFCF